MGCGLVSHFSRKPALNLLPEYQSSGPFFASWSLIVFSEAGPAIWWQEAHLPASKAFLPSATPASAPDETNSAMSTVITQMLHHCHLRVKPQLLCQRTPMNHLFQATAKGFVCQ